MIYWLTGQPGSGKTTLAKKLKERIPNCVHLDGDDLRDIFQNKNYSEEGRKKNISTAQDISKFLNHKGFNVIVSLVSPYKSQREEFKKSNLLVEIYVHTTEKRGREDYHVSDYEKPDSDYVSLDTTGKTEIDSFNELLSKLDL